MSDIRVGDNVRQSAAWEAKGLSPKTFHGEVVAHTPSTYYPYRVNIRGREGVWQFQADELEAAA